MRAQEEEEEDLGIVLYRVSTAVSSRAHYVVLWTASKIYNTRSTVLYTPSQSSWVGGKVSASELSTVRVPWPQQRAARDGRKRRREGEDGAADEVGDVVIQ